MTYRFTAEAQREIDEVSAERDLLKRRVGELESVVAQTRDAQRLLLQRNEIRMKLHAAHAELSRRYQRDLELARHMPVIVARLQSLAADATPGPPDPDRPNWQQDPEIDWTGIEGGHP